jgi:hypothetical protein
MARNGRVGRFGSVITIPPEDREYAPGLRIEAGLLQKIIEAKIAAPLASHELVAQVAGAKRETVSRALATKYAKERLQVHEDVIQAYGERLKAAQGDAIEYFAKSVRRAHSELDNPSPSGSVLTNGRECATTTSRITGLLKDNVKVDLMQSSPLDYKALQELESDPDLLLLQSDAPDAGPQPTTKATTPEGESTPPGVGGEGGDPIPDQPVD